MTEERKQSPGAPDAPPAPVKPPRDHRQDITDRMVAALEQGIIPWEKPWDRLEHGLPRNMASDRPYAGGNRMILMLHQMERGYSDPRYATVKQINELGGRVSKGEKGTGIELWKDQPFWERRDVEITLNKMRVKVFEESQGFVRAGMPTDKAPTLAVKPADLVVQHKGQELTWAKAHKELDSVVGRVYTVFNAEQCTGLKIEPLKAPDNKIPTVDRAEQLMQAMRNDGLSFVTGASGAFYSPQRDEVSLPPRESFKSVEGYYGTALHEVGHATGAEKRLNREGITGGHRFGSEGYAKEELRAELFSTFMAAETGIPHDEEQHKAYVQSWAAALKNDKNEIFRAASEAGKAVDYVLAKERDLQVEYAKHFEATIDKARAEPIVEVQGGQGVEAPGALKEHSQPEQPMTAPQSMDAALVADGWKSTPHGSYEKTFLLDKDKSKGGEFTAGKNTVEKILTAKTRAAGFVIAQGWDDFPVQTTPGITPAQAVQELDKFAKNLLATEHAHLGVTAVRGKNETAPQQPPVMTADQRQEAIRREDELLSKEPHELTFAEFTAGADVKRLGPNHGRQWEVFDGSQQRGTSLGFSDAPTAEGARREAHEREVNNALYGNQPDVPDFLRKSMPPANVLAEYPELQKRWAGVIEAKQSAALPAQEPMDRADSETQNHSAYDQAIQNFIKGGRGNGADARRILDGEMAGDVDPKRFRSALIYHGFAPMAGSEKLAAAMLVEENQKVLAKEDRKSSEVHVAQQVEEAVGKGKPSTPTQPLQEAVAARADIPRSANGRAVLPDDRRQMAEASVGQLDPITDGALFRVGQGRGTELDRAYLGRAGLLDAEGDLPRATADMICVQAAIQEKAFTAAFGPDKAAMLLSRMDDATLKAVAEDRAPAPEPQLDRKSELEPKARQTRQRVSAER